MVYYVYQIEKGMTNMKLELTEKTYSSVFSIKRILAEGYDMGTITTDIIDHPEFKCFVHKFDRRFREQLKNGWSIDTDEYTRFIDSPYMGGNADMLGDPEVVDILDEYPNGMLRVLIEITVSATMRKD